MHTSVKEVHMDETTATSGNGGQSCSSCPICTGAYDDVDHAGCPWWCEEAPWILHQHDDLIMAELEEELEAMEDLDEEEPETLEGLVEEEPARSEQYERLWAIQKGRCACCGTEVVHRTGVVDGDPNGETSRGLICVVCSDVLDLIDGNLKSLRRVLEYVSRARGPKA
jgi:hypothetical protein